jgi:hypothetical protein
MYEEQELTMYMSLTKNYCELTLVTFENSIVEVWKHIKIINDDNVDMFKQIYSIVNTKNKQYEVIINLYETQMDECERVMLMFIKHNNEVTHKLTFFKSIIINETNQELISKITNMI